MKVCPARLVMEIEPAETPFPPFRSARRVEVEATEAAPFRFRVARMSLAPEVSVTAEAVPRTGEVTVKASLKEPLKSTFAPVRAVSEVTEAAKGPAAWKPIRAASPPREMSTPAFAPGEPTWMENLSVCAL